MVRVAFPVVNLEIVVGVPANVECRFGDRFGVIRRGEHDTE
jgi:hypothetical protein